MFAGKKSAQIREILINESAWEEMTCLFAPSLAQNTLSLIEIVKAVKVNTVIPVESLLAPHLIMELHKRNKDQ